MSLVGSRLSLTHRCSIERDAATAGSWGTPDAHDWQPHLTDVPCRAWMAGGRGEIIADKTSIVVDDEIRVLVPVGTDVTERDQVGDISYRSATIFAGPLTIRAVNPWPDHIELVLVAISG